MGHVRPRPARPGHEFHRSPAGRPSGPGSALAPGAVCALLCLLVTLTLPGAARAQLSPLLVEVRGGAALPSGDFLDGATGWDGTGGEAPRFGAGFTLIWGGRWGWTVGFGQDRFTCPAETCGDGDELVATGFDLGLRILLRSGGRVVPWIGGGGLSYRAERHRNGAGSTVTDRAWGWKAGAGVYLVLTDRLYLNPSARYRALDLDRDEPGEVRVRAVVVDLGLVLAF